MHHEFNFSHSGQSDSECPLLVKWVKQTTVDIHKKRVKERLSISWSNLYHYHVTELSFEVG